MQINLYASIVYNCGTENDYPSFSSRRLEDSPEIEVRPVSYLDVFKNMAYDIRYIAILFISLSLSIYIYIKIYIYICM